MPRNIELVDSNGVGTGRRTKFIGGIDNVNKPVVRSMLISESTFQRLKHNSSWYRDSESYEEIIIRLLDFYEKNNKMRFDYH